MKSILSQCGKVKRDETSCLVLKLYLCNKLIIIGSFLGNFRDEIGMDNCNLKFYVGYKKKIRFLPQIQGEIFFDINRGS